MHLLQSSKDISSDMLDNWGDRIGSRKLSREIAACDRFSDRVLNRVFASAALDTQNQSALEISDVPTQQVTSEDIVVGKVVAENTGTFLNVCGIVVYGDVYRKNVSRSEFGNIQRSFTPEELRLGCQLRDEHRKFSQNQLDMARLPELTKMAGNHCLASWIQSMPDHFRRELEMLGIHSSAFSMHNEIGLTHEHAIRIVRSVGNLLGHN